MRRFIKKGIVRVFAISCICFWCLNVEDIHAEGRKGNEIVSMTESNVLDFLNQYFNNKMEEYGVPGAAVSVVKDGKEFVTASYGVENIETQNPVTDQTSFPACSVSKLFTATAIMQLYEQGKIDLSEDITCYLPELEIRNSFEEKITCHQLLTHTSGLDEQSELDGSTLDITNIKSQQTYFSTHIPTVIHEPGTISCYSNMGYNILGYIVEKVSGQTYEDYVQSHILNQLNMRSSSVRIEKGNRAVGYIGENGIYEEQGFAYQYTSGSSGIIAPVKDMENFMILHLNHGAFENQKVLSSSSENLMQKKEFANNDVFDGMGYGWIRTSYGNINVVKHEGALPGYATTMFLIPQENVGIYVATNSTTGICFDFEETFMKYFYGEDKREGSQDASCNSTTAITEDLSVYTGTYRSYDGIAQKNLMKLGILFDETDMEVTKIDQDLLKVTYYDQKKEYIETTLKYCGDGVFLREDGKGYITFGKKTNDSGISYAFTQVSHSTYEKVSVFETKNALLIGSSAFLILLITSVVMLINLFREKYENNSERVGKALIIVGQLITVGTTFLSICLAMCMIYSYDYSSIKVLRMLLSTQVIGVVLMLGSSVYGMCQTIKVHVSNVKFVRSSILLAVQIISVLVLIYFNLLGVHIV